jgi:hypothetical protein
MNFNSERTRKMTGSSSASRDAGVRDWVNTTLHGDDLRPPTNLSQPRGPRQSIHDSTRDLRTGLEVVEFHFDTIPADLLDHFNFK